MNVFFSWKSCCNDPSVPLSAFFLLRTIWTKEGFLNWPFCREFGFQLNPKKCVPPKILCRSQCACTSPCYSFVVPVFYNDVIFFFFLHTSVLGKIKLENLPAISANLGQLGLQLSDFIVNPGVFFAFLGDPSKSKLLVELQGLLPRWVERDRERKIGLIDQSINQPIKK